LTWQEDGHFVMPPLATIENMRVVVATLSTASKLVNLGISRGTHLQVYEKKSNILSLKKQSLPKKNPIIIRICITKIKFKYCMLGIM